MLAPNQKLADELLLNFYTSFVSVKMSAFSLRYSHFNPIIPTPDYIISLNDSFTKAKGLADDWMAEKEPDIISTIPTAFRSYNNRIQTAQKIIQDSSSKGRVIDTLQWLKSHLDSNSTTTQGLQDNIGVFGAEFKSYKTVIDESVEKANNQIQTDRAKVEDLSEQISALYQLIASETEKASGAMSNIASGGGDLSFAILEYAFDVATAADPAFPIVGVVIAVAGLTYEAIVAAINDEKIVENLKKITKLKVELVGENQAIAVLSNMTAMLHQVENTLLGIHNSVDLSPLWIDQSQALDQAIQELQVYSGNDFKSLLPISTFPDAASSWSSIATVATNIQLTDSGLTSGGTLKLN